MSARLSPQTLGAALIRKGPLEEKNLPRPKASSCCSLADLQPSWPATAERSEANSTPAQPRESRESSLEHAAYVMGGAEAAAHWPAVEDLEPTAAHTVQ